VNAIEVYTCFSYPAVPAKRTRAQWATVQLVRALKGQSITGRSAIPLPGGSLAFLDHTTVDAAAGWLGQMAAEAVPWDDLGRISLVPLPNSRCNTAQTERPRTALLAAAIARFHPLRSAVVCDVLRWADPMDGSQCQSGTRDPQELYSALRLRARNSFDRTGNYVIVDDVLVTGGHVRAVAAFLTDCGANALCAVCAARAEHVLREQPFQCRLEFLPPFVADPDWLLPFSGQSGSI
jgi:hypothetical protein